MLNPLDDYPIHQTADPIAVPLSGDRNVYDRYFFNGYSPSGDVYFAAAMGLYPNRSVADASFSIVRDGVQTSIHASRRAPLDRTETSVGPIAVAVVEPMRVLRITVGGNESGVEADLTFTARTVALEEPRFTMLDRGRRRMDYTRLTQFGAWRGWVQVDGERVEVGPEVRGSRDRSWGIRASGEPEGGAPSGLPPQFFWLWAPLNFDDRCIHFDVQENGEGRQWHHHGVVVPVLGDDRSPVVDYGAPSGEVMAAVDHRIAWKPGTRRAQRAELVLTPFEGEPLRVELEPMLDFQMLGLGYLHPEWGHGLWKGEQAVGVEQWRLADLDPLAPQHVHVQALCRVRAGDDEGIGVLEQLAIGPHRPSGFSSLFDGAAG